MKRVIVESAFRGANEAERARNLNYAKTACMDCCTRNETPFASHVFFPLFLDEDNPDHRKIGITMGYSFWEGADLIVFYVDFGWSSGMKDALVRAVEHGKPYEIRNLDESRQRELRSYMAPDLTQRATLAERMEKELAATTASAPGDLPIKGPGSDLDREAFEMPHADVMPEGMIQTRPSERDVSATPSKLYAGTGD